MKPKLLALALVLNCFLNVAAYAQAKKETWFSPISFTDANAQARFEVDSTWHMVEGKTSGLNGTLMLEDATNPATIKAKIFLPVKNFNTDNDSRDEEMRTVMVSEKFPNVQFIGTGLKGSCTPTKVESDGSCQDSLAGTLTIKDITLPVELPLTIEWKGEAFLVTGKMTLKWADYGVEDPSIFIARLDELVTVYFEARLAPAVSAH